MRRRAARTPLLVSVHGGDVLYTARRGQAGARRSRAGSAPRRSCSPTARASQSWRAATARASTRVVHLGTRRSSARRRGGGAERRPPTLVTVGPPGRAQAPRRRAARARRAALAPPDAALRDHRRRARAHGARRPRDASRRRRARRASSASSILRRRSRGRARCTLFVMPSTEEAFGVGYVEAMAAGVPAIGCRGEPGPEEIAAAGDGFLLVPPGDIERLTSASTSCSAIPTPARGGRSGRAQPWPPTSPGSAAASETLARLRAQALGA